MSTMTTQQMNFFAEDTKSALEAKTMAQWIAFGPVVFQVARVMRNSGILKLLEENRHEGLTLEEIVDKIKLPHYGVRVLLESSLGIGLIVIQEEKYKITKTGHFILNDPLARTNMDFIHDVCYRGLFSLDKSIETGRPEGLKEFGDWNTIYEGLFHLPLQVQKSWFSFEHFFSDYAFPAVIGHVYKNGIRKVLDIGGNTGKWAIASTRYSDNIEVTIMDLPGQLEVARKKISELHLEKRIHFFPVNILDESISFPKGFDAIWMSQFLDCFSEKEIISILKRCHEAISDDGIVLILEAFWDTQRFEAAAFCLQQTSIYFTALANGNSQMYQSEVFINCIHEAGFEIVERVDQIGLSHTLLKCKKKN
jgi:ubiquinone/menaquinone biosynthesis C-methylase UbiE